jgi:RNA polymerase primary sigma factor
MKQPLQRRRARPRRRPAGRWPAARTSSFLDEETRDREAAQPEEEEQPRAHDGPKSTLGMYFRDVAKITPLKPRQEFELAQMLEARELELWTLLFGHRPLVERVADACERELGAPIAELAELRQAAASPTAHSQSGESRLRQAIERAAAAMLRRDPDKQLQAQLCDDLRRLASDVPGRALAGELGLSPDSRAFEAHVARVRHARAAAQRAKNEFVKANLRLVVSVARRFHFGSLPLADLIQEGNLGLVKAVDRYDYRRGYRFSTYASWWIRHAISRALADKARAVRLPVHVLDSVHQVRRSERELTRRLGRAPTLDELHAETGLAVDKLERMRSLTYTPVSLDKPLGDDEEGRRLLEVIQDPDAENRTHADTLAERALAAGTRAELDELRPFEADVLRQRFGIGSGETLTLKQIGAKYNLSRERIRQIQEQALSKVRRGLARKNLL